MRTIILFITAILIGLESNLVVAQEKPCLPDSLQHLIYAMKIEGKDTLFRSPTEVYRLFDFKNYHYRDCLNPFTISKICQVFRGEIDYLPQELRSNRESYFLAYDTPKRVLKIKQKYPLDSLTTEMAIDTLIKESSMKNINFNIARDLSLPRTNLILKIGRIYLKEMIPDLEWALTQDSSIFPLLQVKLALARLGEKKYQEYFFDFYKNYVNNAGQYNDIRYAKRLNELDGLRGKREVLEYINTQESWNILLEENLNTNILRIELSGGEYTSYRKEFVYHPKFPFKNLEEDDRKKYENLFFRGPQKACYSMDSPEKVWETCPKEAGVFLYNLHQKYIKDFVMPYDYER